LITYLNFLLRYTLPTHPTGRGLAIDEGVVKGQHQLRDDISQAFTSVGMFGTRPALGLTQSKREPTGSRRRWPDSRGYSGCTVLMKR
jgi:hypothetical protein